MKPLALGLAGLFAMTAAAPASPPSAAYPGRYPLATMSDLGAPFVSEVDADATLTGVQIFVAAGLERQTTRTSGIAALVADCISRTPVAVDVAGPAPLAVDVAATPLPAPSSSTASASPAPSPSSSGAPLAPASAPPLPLAPATPKSLPLQVVPPGTLAVKDAIAAKGGTLTYTVDGRSAHFYLEGTASELPELVKLFSIALAAPDFSPATLNVARASLISRADDLEGNALSVGIEMFRRSYYATGAALPALGSAASLTNLGSSDVAAFYAAYYRRGALFASAVGSTSAATTDALRSLVAALPDGTPPLTAPKAQPIPATAPRIVARRDVAVPLVVVGFGAPSPGSKDFGAMLVLESLLSDAFERDSATTLTLAQRSVGAFYLYDSAPASLVVYVNGGRIDPSLALREVLTVAKSLSLKPLGATALKHFKTAAEGEFITDSVSLSDRSYLLGTFATQGLGNDAINAALAALDRTTPADIQRVAKNYLQRYIVALVLPRGDGGGT